LGTPRIRQKQHNNSIVNSIQSEEEVTIKLKIEVNTREHFSIYGIQHVPVRLESEWESGEALVATYELDELLATKLRDLYQRKKGRDLFDLWYAMNNVAVNVERIINAFHHYLAAEGNKVTQNQFIENMEKKILDPDFQGDMNGLLRSGIEYEIAEAYDFVKTNLLEKI
jgi:predicted nucleotidyltransferase component of viral defense system